MIVNRYDASGNQVEQLYYDSFEVLEERCVYTYDSMGNIVAITIYDASGEKIDDLTFEIEYR
jgi:hypothetical protein